jgi:hypothetical protein
MRLPRRARYPEKVVFLRNRSGITGAAGSAAGELEAEFCEGGGEGPFGVEAVFPACDDAIRIKDDSAKTVVLAAEHPVPGAGGFEPEAFSEAVHFYIVESGIQTGDCVVEVAGSWAGGTAPLGDLAGDAAVGRGSE